MNIRIFSSERLAAKAVADDVAAALRADPRLVLGLPTGRTSIELYRRLATLCARGLADFSRCTTFNLDEFLGVPPADGRSYRAFMERHLFRHINITRSHINFLDGSTPDADAECARYDRVIENAGGIGLLLLGLGANGHIGFNEPGPSLSARTHVVRLTAETRRANAAWFGRNAARVPRAALSMGMAAILQARSIVLIAAGRAKARSVERMVNGPLTTRLPASFLQMHPEVSVMLDQAAARQLDR